MSGGSNEDEILEMFFDESFVPHAFADILLSNAASKDISQVQSTSSSLLSRLDFYTKNLTKELEVTIQKLEKLSGTLPGTWTVEMGTAGQESASVSAVESSKLEYYLDTLGSAVRVLEADMGKIDDQMVKLDNEYKSSSNIIDQLRNLETIETRQLQVLGLFDQVRSILNVSTPNNHSKKDVETGSSSITVGNFKDSLELLEHNIKEALVEAGKRESVMEKDEDLIKRINLFIQLKPLFQGLSNFCPIYSQFVNEIRKSANAYLSIKDISSDLS